MDYGAVYPASFFSEADGIGEWRARKLKYGDALAAIGYAFGLPSFDAVREALSFTGTGQCVEDGMDAGAQLARLTALQTRAPRGILEIGSGRGEVAVSLAHLGYPVQAIEPSPGAVEWCARTAERFYGQAVSALPLRILNAPGHTVLDEIDWSAIDTVLMVESLEHILAEDFEPVRLRIVEALRKNSGRFIVTNWIDYHPIEVGWYAATDVHCRLVDDALFDEWAKEGNVVFREGAHLVLDYAPRAEMPRSEGVSLRCRTQTLVQNAAGRNEWSVIENQRVIEPARLALLLCDLYDAIWSRAMQERLNDLAVRVNAVANRLRAMGALIIHGPSDVADIAYAGTPARIRALAAPRLTPPPELPHDYPKQPIDASDGGSDSLGDVRGGVWSKQHPAIAIDDTKDVICADGIDVYSCLKAYGIDVLLIAGVHLNECVLRKSLGIKQMVRWGVDTLLVRDLTDTAYNPAMPPYVSHEEGTRLMVEFVEKFWCGSVASGEL